MPPKRGRGCLVAILLLGLAGILFMALSVVVAVLLPAFVAEKKTATQTAGPTFDTNAPIIPSLAEFEPPENTEILSRLYPGLPFENGKIRRRAAFEDGGEEELPPEERLRDVLTWAEYVMPYARQGRDAVLVILGSVPVAGALDDGTYPHAISPTLGAAILERDGASWRVAAHRDDLGDFGAGYGALPSGRHAEIGPGRYAFLLDGGFLGQGYHISDAVIVGETPGGSVGVLADIDMAQANANLGRAAEMPYAFDSRIEFLFDSARGDYYPFRVTREGTCRSPDGAVVPVKHEVIYVMGNQGYEPEGGTDPVKEACDGAL